MKYVLPPPRNSSNNAREIVGFKKNNRQKKKSHILGSQATTPSREPPECIRRFARTPRKSILANGPSSKAKTTNWAIIDCLHGTVATRAKSLGVVK